MAQRMLKGIDGWLLFFMAALVIVALIQLVLFAVALDVQVRRAAFYGPLPLWVTINGWIYNAVEIAGPLVIFWRMLRVRRWSSIRFAVAGLWFVAVGAPLIDFACAALAVPGSFGRMLPLLIHSLLGETLMALIGTFYLAGSARVANTYPHPQAAEALGEVFE
jgi:hypothetical protein